MNRAHWPATALIVHVNNGDEELYQNKIGSYSKALLITLSARSTSPPMPPSPGPPTHSSL
jgi:hypothetical protein